MNERALGIERKGFAQSRDCIWLARGPVGGELDRTGYSH